MLRVSLFIASALLLLITSCSGPPEGDALQPGRAAPPAAPTATQQPENTATPGDATKIVPAATLPPDSTATGEKNVEAISVAEPTVTLSPTPTLTETATPTSTPTPAVTITVVPPQPTATPTATASLTPPTPQPTATATPTSGLEPTATATPTADLEPTVTPTPTTRPTPIPAAVFVRSHTSYALGSQLVVVGELLNGAAFDAFNVRVDGRFYNIGGALIATADVQAAFAKVELERPAPFRLVVDIDPDAVHRYELTVSFEEISISEYRELEVSAVAIVERDGRMLVVGSLHNGHENALSSVVVAATFYDEDGEVVDVVENSLWDEVISPGADISFVIPLPGTGRMYTRVLVLAQGRLNLF